MTAVRKAIRIPADEAALVTKFAEVSQVPVSAVVREWVEFFAEHGSTLQPQPENPPTQIQFFVEPDVYEKAEALAQNEYGCTLRDIIRHEVAALGEL